MLTWDEFTKPRTHAPEVDVGSMRAALTDNTKFPGSPLIIQGNCDAGGVWLNREEALALRNFLNIVLPLENSVSAPYPETEEHVGSEVKGAANDDAAELVAAADEAHVLTPGGPVQVKPEPQDAADPGDEEVPIPGDAPEPKPEPTPADLRTHGDLVESITKLVKDFVVRDTNYWAYTDYIFVNRNTTQDEVILGRVSNIEVLKAIEAELKTEWQKRYEPPSNPKKDKPNGRKK